MRKPSAGLIMYRVRAAVPEILLVHPGGPFFKNKDDHWWSIPKGELHDSEDLLVAAKREFEEETSFKAEGEFEYLGEAVREKDGKTVTAWAFKGDCDPHKMKSNMVQIEWPPGTKVEAPEVDRAAFFTLADARRKMQPYMVPLIDLFESRVKYGE